MVKTIIVILPLLLCLSITSCTFGHASTHILFIGNSFTEFNGGIDQGIRDMATSTATERVLVGGETLESHWNKGDALRAIRKGGWSYVVLQEQSLWPVLARDKFFQYVRMFDKEIRAAGGQTVLLMTWERPDSVSNGVTTTNLAAAYNAIGAEVRAIMVPAGIAFARSRIARPDLSLSSADGHPTVYGTYLATCVLYGAVFGKSPTTASHDDSRVPGDLRTYFKRIAAETLGY